MCCDGWCLEVEDEDDVVGECPDCGRETIGGAAKYGCNYSPESCSTCGARDCDLSC